MRTPKPENGLQGPESGPGDPSAFEIDKRRAMTPARKLRIWTAREGKCGFCFQAVEVSGPGVIYDHFGQLWVTGSDADSDIWPIHADPCNKIKTAADATTRAKIKRLIAGPKAERNREKGKPGIKSRGFGNLSKGFDGKVRPKRERRSYGRNCGNDAGRNDGPGDGGI